MINPIKNFTLAVNFIKEGRSFIAYSPALDLSTSGKTEAEARSRFEEIVQMFFDDIVDRGVFAEVLTELGWSNNKTSSHAGWRPPIVRQRSIDIKVPVPA